MAYKVSIELQFDAAHRLCDYEGKCHNLHGHTYFAIVEVTAAELIPPGFVVDFAALKRTVKKFIDGFWDHATILWREDPLVDMLEEQGLRIYRMDNEPTAEYMAEHLFGMVDRDLPNTVAVTQVSIMETPTSTAIYKLSNV